MSNIDAEQRHLEVPRPDLYKAVCRILFGPYINGRRIEVSGQENLPRGSAPYIIAASHRSLLDIPVLANALLEHDGTQIHFVGKRELWKNKIFGKFIDTCGSIQFDRDEVLANQPRTKNQVAEVLQSNGVVGIFPEGTRRRGPKVEITKRGLGILAVANYVPIVTAGIAGTESLFGRIHVHFGNVIHPGVISPDNRRRRMIEMEQEYTASLQNAFDEAARRLED
jgi:1-acyl-sn-glycerol-3-phosphate acyltransferase